MRSATITIDPLNMPDGMEPVLGRFFKWRVEKKGQIQRGVVYHFEKHSLLFTHDIYLHLSAAGKWKGDVLASEPLYKNDFILVRAVCAVIHGATGVRGHPPYTLNHKHKRNYYFLASEVQANHHLVRFFPSQRPRMISSGKIISQLAFKGEILWDYLTTERTIPGKVLASRQRFRLVLSLLRAIMQYHQRGICHRTITLKDIVYDEADNATAFISMRLAKMMTNTKENRGGLAHAKHAAPEEFINQSEQHPITADEYKGLYSMISKAGLPADVYMAGMMCLQIWRHQDKNPCVHAHYQDYFLDRAANDWEIKPNLFDGIFDLAQDEMEDISSCIMELLSRDATKRPTIFVCYERFQGLYLKHKLRNEQDVGIQKEISAANALAATLHRELMTIECNSIFLNYCLEKLATFKLDWTKSFTIFRKKLESNKKDNLCGVMLLQLEPILQQLGLPADFTIDAFISTLTSCASAAKLQDVLMSSILKLNDHPAAVAEFIEYCAIPCLTGIETKQMLIEKIEHIFAHHAELLARFNELPEKYHHELSGIKHQLTIDVMTLEALHQQSQHLAIKLEKLDAIRSPDHAPPIRDFK